VQKYLTRLQVGKDQEAQAFLGKLDNDPVIGREVDATSYFELEAMEYQRKGVVSASVAGALLWQCRPRNA